MHTITIGVASASASINITPAPAFAVKTTASGSNSPTFVPNPTNPGLIDVLGSQFTPEVNTQVQTSVIGGIVNQQPLSIQVGAEINSLVPQLLNAFQYVFDDFENPGSIANAEYGDVVFLYPATGANNYQTQGGKASVTNTSFGALSNLFIFQSYIGNTLKLMHKGYIEIPESKFTATHTWQSGYTIYLSNDNKLSTQPATESGNWVRSLGFCVPNKENKRIIWFEPDSTYLKLI